MFIQHAVGNRVRYIIASLLTMENFKQCADYSSKKCCKHAHLLSSKYDHQGQKNNSMSLEHLLRPGHLMTNSNTVSLMLESLLSPHLMSMNPVVCLSSEVNCWKNTSGAFSLAGQNAKEGCVLQIHQLPPIVLA